MAVQAADCAGVMFGEIGSRCPGPGWRVQQILAVEEGGQEVATYSREKPLEKLLLASLSCKPDSGLGHFLNVLVGLQP